MKSYEQIVEDLDTGENENLKEFFSDHSEAFDTPEKKAVFLEGVLAQNLMDKQRMMRETDEPPFRKKLANLRLNSNKVKQLFPEISQTLDIYNSKAEPQYRNSYSDLRETIGHYLLLSDQNNWSISDDEISYFFTLGMSLNQVFKNNNNGEQ
jgi:CRISPR-associated protein Csh1